MKYFTQWICRRKIGVYLFFLLGCFVSNVWCLNFALAQVHEAPIEIIVHGKKFESIEQYRQSKQNVQDQKALGRSVISGKRFVSPLFYFASKNPDLIRFDQVQNLSNKQSSKTFLKREKMLRPYDQLLPAFAAMSKVGFNTGVIKMIEAFQKAGSDTIVYKSINSKDLENTLSESFPEGGYSGPILLISDKNKVRILTLDSK